MYDFPIKNTEHAQWCLDEAARRYGGEIVKDEARMLVVKDDAGIVHTDAVLRAVSFYLDPTIGVEP